ncbi:hypothetical protein N9E76_01360, partial [bacterium]|nr:hypothetical protein [bacterium]
SFNDTYFDSWNAHIQVYCNRESRLRRWTRVSIQRCNVQALIDEQKRGSSKNIREKKMFDGIWYAKDMITAYNNDIPIWQDAEYPFDEAWSQTLSNLKQSLTNRQINQTQTTTNNVPGEQAAARNSYSQYVKHCNGAVEMITALMTFWRPIEKSIFQVNLTKGQNALNLSIPITWGISQSQSYQYEILDPCQWARDMFNQEQFHSEDYLKCNKFMHAFFQHLASECNLSTQGMVYWDTTFKGNGIECAKPESLGGYIYKQVQCTPKAVVWYHKMNLKWKWSKPDLHQINSDYNSVDEEKPGPLLPDFNCINFDALFKTYRVHFRQNFRDYIPRSTSLRVHSGYAARGLRSRLLESLQFSLPELGEDVMRELEICNNEEVVMFFRMLRVPNVYALHTLARNTANSTLQEQHDAYLRTLSVSAQSELLWLYRYLRSHPPGIEGNVLRKYLSSVGN